MITTLLAAICLYFVSNGLSNKQYLFATIAAFCNTLNAIYQSYLVFSGRSSSYGMSGAAKAITVLVTFTLLVHTGFDAGVAWSAASVVALIIITCFIYFERDKLKVDNDLSHTNFVSIFRLGMPLAMIYGTATLPFVLDRVVAQSYLLPITFAKYAVAVSWAVPLVYIGNAFQQFIIVDSDENLFSKFFKFAGILFALEACYAAAVIVLVLAGIKIPYFVTSSEFFSFWVPMVSVYGLYSAAAFPAAALIQKSFAVEEITRLAALTGMFVGSACVLLYALKNLANNFGIAAPIICSAVFGLASVLPRLYSVCKHISIKKIA